VIDAGGTGSDNTSIWIVTWGPNTAHGIFPMGKISGLQHWDLSAQFPNGMRVQDANGNYYQAYVDHFKWECGLTVRDWRYCVRIANIDVSDLSTGSAANLMNALSAASRDFRLSRRRPARFSRRAWPGRPRPESRAARSSTAIARSARSSTFRR
jgi:hypothetical protein